MTGRYALIGPDNRAINFISWDGVTEFEYGQAEGNYIVSIEGVDRYGFGWMWDGEKFVDTTVSPVPESITRRQCAMMMFSMQMISGQEAISMTQSGIPPAAVQAYLDQLPEPNRTLAIMDFAAANYFRENPLLLALMMANGMTSEQVDDFFRGASQL